MSVYRWTEDEFTPRVDVLTDDFTAEADVLPVSHPEWFRLGDIVRIGEDDLCESGERHADGTPFMLVRNEAVQITSASGMRVQRALGANPAQPKPKGETVTIIATAVMEDYESEDEW